MYDFSFYCRESKKDRKNLSPVELCVIINGKRVHIALPMKFNAVEFKKKAVSKRNNEVQTYLSGVRINLEKYIGDMILREIPVTADNLKQYFMNGGVQSYTIKDMATDFLKYYNKKLEVGAITKNVVRKYELAYTRFVDFVGNIEINAVTGVQLDEFKYDLLTNFEDSTVNHILKELKSMFIYAVDNGKLKVNPFNTVKIDNKAKEVEYLTNEELTRIIEKDFGNDRLNKVRDLFIFQCLTATSFADMQQIRINDIQIDEDICFIKKKRQKTGIEFFTILTPEAMQILKKYNFDLNVISNQKCNAYLKEIADLCRIDKPLHTHIARHTGATRLLNMGYRLEVVAKILGHTNTRQTQHYAKLLDKTVIKEYKTISQAV